MARGHGYRGEQFRAHGLAMPEQWVKVNADFRDKAPLSAAGAAAIILDGVRAGSWRILVGEDARTLDKLVREAPEAAYDYEALGKAAADQDG
jgi:hypothetical protein